MLIIAANQGCLSALRYRAFLGNSPDMTDTNLLS